MRITTDEKRGVHVLKGEGALSIGAAADAFDEACRQLIGKRGGIVLDLSHLAYVDSTGVASIVACTKRAAERGSVVKVVLAADGAVRRVFEITQLDRAFEIFGDVEAAVASFP